MEVSKQVIESIIKGNDAEALVKEADRLGQYLAKDLSSSQIRNVYGTVKKLSMVWTEETRVTMSAMGMREMLLLKPKLAYQVGRAGRRQSDAIRTLKDVLEACINLLEGDYARFKRFAEFFEAILAYHKAYGGS
jgi:CRISPR-associated protein Csm2